MSGGMGEMSRDTGEVWGALGSLEGWERGRLQPVAGLCRSWGPTTTQVRVSGGAGRKYGWEVTESQLFRSRRC